MELTVRSEISSTLGLKTESCEFDEDRESLLSQGDNCTELLRKNAVLAAKAIPKVKPSDLSTVESVHGENMRLLSLLDCTNDAVKSVVTTEMSRIEATGIAIVGENVYWFSKSWRVAKRYLNFVSVVQTTPLALY